MIRETLQECINLFNASDSFTKPIAVRNMELIGEWRTAAAYWNSLSRFNDEEACLLINKANELGNEYRAAIKPLMDFVEVSVTNDILTRDEALKIISPAMVKIHNAIYQNSQP